MPRPKKQPIAAKVNGVPNQGEEVQLHSLDDLIKPGYVESAVKPELSPRQSIDSPLLPHITIVVVTFRRLNEIRKTIDALLKNVVYPRHKLHWLIADDHSDDTGEYVNAIVNTPRYKMLDMKASITEHNCGWGCNANTAIAKVETELMFFLEDDMQLTAPLDLRVGVALMETLPHVGMLRYRGTAGDHFVLHQMECDISKYLPDYQDAEGLSGKLTYCLIDSGSPSAYVYSNGSHLKRKSFHAPENYGSYDEGKKLGHTEESFAITTKERMKLPNAPAIAILPDFIKNVWNHFGQSYQLTELDKGE